jgi:hypothetical protein
MNVKNWETTIEQIVAESNQQPEESGRHRLLTAWRARLGQEPTLLKPYQIDEIVRAVRTKLVAGNR